jgi:hypothetical protein
VTLLKARDTTQRMKLYFCTFSLLLILTSVASSSSQDCPIIQDANISLASSIKVAIESGCKLIRLPEGNWQLDETVLLEDIASAVTIRGHGVAPVLQGKSPLIIIRRTRNLTIENVTIEGTVEMDQTEDIVFRNILFRRGGLSSIGKKCNQPNECSSYNRRLTVEECIFENCVRGIRAERLESSIIEKNRFTGSPVSCSPEIIGIDLDGSSEDLDRPLELGHNKGNQIVQNSFEQESAIGIRIRDSWSNVIRDNHFTRSYRALEFYEGARYNQVLQSHITYLSQQPASGACRTPCAIYLGPGSINNIFWNNFFEQNFELQFLESNRNKTYVIDESAAQNVFRSDFVRIKP